jgi:zinc protease
VGDFNQMVLKLTLFLKLPTKYLYLNARLLIFLVCQKAIILLFKTFFKNIRLSVCFAAALIFVYFTAHAKETDIVVTEVFLSPRKEEKLRDTVLDKAPVAGKIIDETIDNKTNTIIWTLSNGAKVVLKNTQAVKNNHDISIHTTLAKDGSIHTIDMVALAKGGMLNIPKKDIASAMIVNKCNDICFGNYYSKKINALIGRHIEFHLDKFTHGFSSTIFHIYNYANDIRTLFECLYFTFTNFKIDFNALKIRMAYMKAQLEVDEEYLYYYHGIEQARRKIIYNNDPYFDSNFPLESFDFTKFNKNTASKLIKKYLNPADYTFVFVGSIDVNTFKGYVETYLASIPAGKEKSTLPKYNVTYTGQVKYYKIYTAICQDRPNHDILNAYITFFIREQYFQNNEVIANVLSEYLRSIIKYTTSLDVLGDYYIGGWNSDLKYTISLYYCDSNKIDKNVAAVTENIKAIAAGNINVDIFNKAKKTAKSSEKTYRYTHWLARKYAIAAIYDKPFSDISDIYENKAVYDTVTPKDLQEVVAKALEEGMTCIIEYSKEL